jgi:transposase-like protein
MKQVEFGDKNINLRWAGVKEYFWKHLEEESRRIVKRLLEEGLRVELDYQIGTGRYRRGVERRDYRNGYYLRDLVTSLGMISSFLVPRSRKGVYRSQILERYKRRTFSFDQAVKEMFVLGLSTRRTKEFFDGFFGEEGFKSSGG